MFSNIHKVAQIMCGADTLQSQRSWWMCILFRSSQLYSISRQVGPWGNPPSSLCKAKCINGKFVFVWFFYICILFLLRSACPFRLVDPSVCQARYTKRPSALIFLLLCMYLQRALTLQWVQNRPKNASGPSLITVLISTHP